MKPSILSASAAHVTYGRQSLLLSHLRCTSGIAAFLLGGLLFPGCSSSSSEQGELGQLSTGCLVNSDCAAPLVCAFERCHVECVTTRDCDGKLRCVGAHEQERVCQLEDDATCVTTADCAQGLVCSGDGACRDTCASDRECGGGQVCTKGVCAEPEELDENGVLPQVLPHQTCRLSSDCALGTRCVAGSCLAECVTARDCEPGAECREGACVAAPVASCSADDECVEPGQACLEGVCRCACREDVDCADGASCDGCACVPPPAPECIQVSDCEAGQQCVDGDCVCSCAEDRDCPASLRCDGCACQPLPEPTVIRDAKLLDGSDLARMRGIVEVETTLMLYGADLTGTGGLEGLHTVGRLDIMDVSGFRSPTEDWHPLSGLSGLKLIRGDLNIRNTNALRLLELNPELVVGGTVTIQGTDLSCEQIYEFELALQKNRPEVAVSTSMYNGGCPGFCEQGLCYPPS
jgi:hypothetical protein